jgi:hypothetical protein
MCEFNTVKIGHTLLSWPRPTAISGLFMQRFFMKLLSASSGEAFFQRDYRIVRKKV